MRELPMSMGVVSFTKDASHAAAAADALLAQGMPAAVVSIEAPGANEQGFTTMRAAWTSPFWKPKPTRSGPNCANWAYRV